MNKFIEDNIILLCDSTVPNDTLVDNLQLANIISQEINQKIKSQHGNLSKNTVLYTFLQTAVVDRHLEGILRALKSSSNSRAYNIFQQFQVQTMSAQAGPGPQLQPDKGNSAVKSPKAEMRTFEIANSLVDDDDVLRDINTLYKTFGVSKSKVDIAIKNYAVGVRTAGDLLGEIFQCWRSGRRSEQAKGQHFLEILKDKGYITATETLENAGLGPDTQIQN